jgi:hypothetical protein
VKNWRETILDSDYKYALVEAGGDYQDLIAADLLRDLDLNKKAVSVDTIERVLNKYGL